MPVIRFTAIPADFSTSVKICQLELSKLSFYRQSDCQLSLYLPEIERDTPLVNRREKRLETMTYLFHTIVFNINAKSLLEPDDTPAVERGSPNVFPQVEKQFSSAEPDVKRHGCVLSLNF